MASYCQQGDTARVTLADGRIFEYTQNLPINIECIDEYNDCSTLNITYSYQSLGLNPQTITRGIRAPYGGIRISGSNSTAIEILCRGSPANSCGTYRWYVFQTTTTSRPYINLTFISLVPAANTTVTKRLTIIDSLTNILFNEVVPTCGYTVECLEGCPPNTLDCGDCCLPCDSVFNEISSIRALVKGLK